MKKDSENSDKLDNFNNVVNWASLLCFSFCLNSLLVDCIDYFAKISNRENLALVTAGTVITVPTVNFGMKVILKIREEKFLRDQHYFCQTNLMVMEEEEGSHKITRMTPSFVNEITEIFRENDLELSYDDIFNINQFVYLINANYYERLKDLIPGNSRKEKIDTIINQISYFLSEVDNKKFDDKMAMVALNYCFFIPQDIRHEIGQEFKKSKVKSLNKVIYKITRGDVKPDIPSYRNEREKAFSEEPTPFDFNDSSWYLNTIVSYAFNPKYREKGYGDPRDLEWDITSLKKVLNIIASHRNELMKEKSNYSDIELAESFVFNAMVYASTNGHQKVGIEEYIRTFKNWDYLPFFLKLKVIDEVLDDNNLDYSYNPFDLKKPRPVKTFQKIIPFSHKI